MGTPIINQPQVGIIAIGVIRKLPSVIETDKGDFVGIRKTYTHIPMTIELLMDQ